MISVLCPTRLRPWALRESIASLRNLAVGDLEILLAVDDDDPNCYADVGSVLITRRVGYPRLHHYYNLLVERAVGQWLLLWNDDAVMMTDEWDKIVRSHKPSVILSPSTVHNPLCTFPIVPRRFVEAVGHFSLNAHCDTWWQEIGDMLGVLRWPAIRVEHRRADLTGENDDSVFREREYQTADFEALRPERERDAETIRVECLRCPACGGCGVSESDENGQRDPCDACEGSGREAGWRE